VAERLTISRLGSAGDGVAGIEERTVHVALALPGETVLARVEGTRATVVAIEVSSPDRVTPFCPYFTQCGGCVFQHLDQNVYAAWKRDKVISALAGRGLDVAVGPLVDAHGDGRRRVTLHLRRVEGEIRAGFMAAGTHRLVPIDSCPITVPALRRAPAAAEALARRLMTEEDKSLDALVTASSEGLDVDLRGSGRPGERKLQALVASALELDLARLSVHGELVIERRRPAIAMGRSVVVPPPGGFLQATARGEEALAAEVLRAASGRRRVVDLFSGLGPFALRLAETAEVHAVEGQAAMLAALDRAARDTPGLRRVTTETRDLFRRPLLAPELERFDLAVIDPPRQGAEAQARQLAASSLDRVILVSCDPGTFARDAAQLVEGGFKLESVLPVDQFKWSTHVEMVGVLARPTTRRRARRR
jgi:23S rRNA (uracil1939-C5)-methyltransferase